MVRWCSRASWALRISIPSAFIPTTRFCTAAFPRSPCRNWPVTAMAWRNGFSRSARKISRGVTNRSLFAPWARAVLQTSLSAPSTDCSTSAIAFTGGSAPALMHERSRNPFLSFSPSLLLPADEFPSIYWGGVAQIEAHLVLAGFQLHGLCPVERLVVVARGDHQASFSRLAIDKAAPSVQVLTRQFPRFSGTRGSSACESRRSA